MYPLRMIVGSSGQGKALPQEDRGTSEREDRRVQGMAHPTASAAEIRAAVGTTVTQRTVTNRLLQGQLRDRRPVACIPLTPNHCRLRRQWCQARAHWRRDWRSVVFSDESRFCLVASDGRVLVRRRQVSACNQPVCGLDTLDLHLELWSVEQFPVTAGALSWSSHVP
ncbi:hypothetical protein AVEN_242636-1 [Araneus ventricosus]|uniref:Transposase Tc1-like domain-containing protein n=1 Tax=Araneus ventricosus TaxID=182803 RepID=A0A4Y2N7L6_ARAVE|nr:hypothetical protein AVEN_242636-1 [Araneus ventricosus]